MKKRFRNIITTILGIVIGLSGLVFLWFNRLSSFEVVPVWLLSWTFISAKDSLLEGLTAGILKIKQ